MPWKAEYVGVKKNYTADRPFNTFVVDKKTYKYLKGKQYTNEIYN